MVGDVIGKRLKVGYHTSGLSATRVEVIDGVDLAGPPSEAAVWIVMSTCL